MVFEALAARKIAGIERSRVDPTAEVRDYYTIHDSEIGAGCRIYERVSIKKCKIGRRVDINAGTYIEYATIGNDVQIGPNCSIVGVSHKVSEKGAGREDAFQRINIGKGVFIGASCVIPPGLIISEGAVVGAGTTARKNIPPFHICVGVPPNQTIVSLQEWLSRD